MKKTVLITSLAIAFFVLGSNTKSHAKDYLKRLPLISPEESEKRSKELGAQQRLAEQPCLKIDSSGTITQAQE